MADFVNQYSLGNNQYLKTVTPAIGALNNHQSNDSYYDSIQRSHTNTMKKMRATIQQVLHRGKMLETVVLLQKEGTFKSSLQKERNYFKTGVVWE